LFERLANLFRRRRAQPEAAGPEPVSRAEKYEPRDGVMGLLRRQGEAERARVDAFLRSVKDAYDTIKVWRAPAPDAAMDAADPLETLSQALAKSAMDDDGPGGLPFFKQAAVSAGAQLQLMPWFMQQGFIGYQNAAFIAQHWLIYKACATPVDDAIRNGYDITTVTGEDLPEDALKILKTADRKFGLIGGMREFGTKGRMFGIRIALFEVDSDDEHYYEKPFNIDGVKEGSYKGFSQVDPYWCAPILDIAAAATPGSKHFYEPTWWLIGSRRIHRSHLVIFRYADPPDVLKPLYLFGGIPLPQMIMERVYCAERTANEAPALALSKRTTVWLTNMAAVMADTQKADYLMQKWIAMRDNFGIKMGDKTNDEFEQFDTPLADFDSLVMTQYSLVAATAGCPITKLLGTTPGGFAATGDYDEASYHEMLESMQERDLTPLASRHHALVMRSEVVPKFESLRDTEVVVTWRSLDVPTHVEMAQVNLNKAETDASLIASGVLGRKDSRARIASDRDSGYHGIGLNIEDEELPDIDDPEAAAEGAGPASRVAKAAEQAEGKGKNGRSANGRGSQ